MSCILRRHFKSSSLAISSHMCMYFHSHYCRANTARRTREKSQNRLDNNSNSNSNSDNNTDNKNNNRNYRRNRINRGVSCVNSTITDKLLSKTANWSDWSGRTLLPATNMRVISPRRPSTSAAGSGSLYGTSSVASGAGSASSSGSGSVSNSGIGGSAGSSSNGYSRYSSTNTYYDHRGSSLSKYLPSSSSASSSSSSAYNHHHSSLYPSSYTASSPRISTSQRNSIGSASYPSGITSSSGYRSTVPYSSGSSYDTSSFSRYGVSVTNDDLIRFNHTWITWNPPFPSFGPQSETSPRPSQILSLICWFTPCPDYRAVKLSINWTRNTIRLSVISIVSQFADIITHDWLQISMTGLSITTFTISSSVFR